MVRRHMERRHLERGRLVMSTSTETMPTATTAAHRRSIVALLLVIAMLTGLLVTPAAARGGKKGRNDRAKVETTVSEPAPTTTTTTTVAPVKAEPVSTDLVSTDLAVVEPVTVDGYDPAVALGSMYNVVDQIHARELWQRGITGAGIDIAVIDTGVAPVPALTGADKVVAMVDLSFEAGIAEAQYLDTNGHGTHMTGIIAGRTPGADPATATPDEFFGVAPDAGIVSVKVGDNTGAVDVSQVIAGIDWVVQHANDDGLNIRVINLSYGTDGTQDYRIDPLARAVENAWEHGIVVVAASGNDGWTVDGALTNPAFDPYVIAVSAAEATETGMDIPQWSSSGEYETVTDDGRSFYWQDGYTGRRADLFAPGSHIDSLRAPGSRVDSEHPEGLVTDEVFRGSGSSQAAAVTSGAVALLLQHRPELTPDQVKELLRSTTTSLGGNLDKKVGQGLLDVAAAAVAAAPTDATQTWERSTGLGSLEASRGTQHVILDGVVLEGEVTAFGTAWDADAWVEASTLGASWTGASWTGASWTGASWTGASWTGASWTGASWTGASWTGASWTGASWTGASWTGASWTGASWTGASWTGASWTGASWTGASWTGASWS